jgi:hypothetical protein
MIKTNKIIELIAKQDARKYRMMNSIILRYEITSKKSSGESEAKKKG